MTYRTYYKTLIKIIIIPLESSFGTLSQSFNISIFHDQIDDMMLMMQYVYYGGVDVSMRYKVNVKM